MEPDKLNRNGISDKSELTGVEWAAYALGTSILDGNKPARAEWVSTVYRQFKVFSQLSNIYDFRSKIAN